MKRALIAGLVLAVSCLALPSRAGATQIFQITLKQGANTFAACIGGPTGCNVAANTVGDYSWQTVTGAFLDSSPQSQAAITGIQVKRIAAGSTDPLEVFLSVVDYTMPLGAMYSFATTHSASRSQTTNQFPVDFQGWIDFNNAGWTTNPFVLGVFTNGQITCTPTATDPGSCSVDGVPITVPGSVMFSMTTKTTVNIPQNDLTSLMTLGDQANVSAAQGPEPVTLSLFGLGLLGLAARRRNRK